MPTDLSQYVVTGYMTRDQLARYLRERHTETDPARRARLERILRFHQRRKDGTNSAVEYNLWRLRRACELIIAGLDSRQIVDFDQAVTVIEAAAAILLHSREDWLDTQTPDLIGVEALATTQQYIEDYPEDAVTLPFQLKEDAKSAVDYSLTFVVKALIENDPTQLPE